MHERLVSGQSVFATFAFHKSKTTNSLTQSPFRNSVCVPDPMSPFNFSGSVFQSLCVGRGSGDLTDADLLGVEGLAAVVGRPGEIGRRGVDDAGSGAPQDEGELTQHAWERGGEEKGVRGSIKMRKRISI